MRSENIIEDLFEAARSEKPVRDLSQVNRFIQKDMVGTQSSLVTKWLKQNKMNILITMGGILITTTALLFPQVEVTEMPTITQETVKITETPMITQETETPVVLVPTTEERKKESKEFVEEVTREKGASGNDIEVVTESDEKEDVVETHASSSRKVGDQSKSPLKPLYIFKNVDPARAKVSEHSIVLESNGGRQSADRFDAYLQRNLSKLNPKLTRSASSSSIRKFTLSLDNRAGADFRIQVTGFERLELHWTTDSKNEISNMWYTLDSNERNELDLSKGVESSIKVKSKKSGF